MTRVGETARRLNASSQHVYCRQEWDVWDIRMDWDWIINLPQYRYGLTLFGLMAIVPALVSGNMLIHELGRLRQGKKDADGKAVLFNAVALIVSVVFISGAIYQWL